MATPTANTWTQTEANQGLLVWEAAWTTTDNFTDSQVLDLSGQVNTNALRILYVKIIATSGIGVSLDFDCTSNQRIISHPDGRTDDVEQDFTRFPGGAATKQNAGSTGDLLLTTTGAASGDQVLFYVHYQVN